MTIKQNEKGRYPTNQAIEPHGLPTGKLDRNQGHTTFRGKHLCCSWNRRPLQAVLVHKYDRINPWVAQIEK